jgi:hypothetical protein
VPSGFLPILGKPTRCRRGAKIVIELTKAHIDRFADYKAGYLPSELGSGPAFRTSIGQSMNSIVQLAETNTCLKRKEFFKSALGLDEFRERVLLEDGAKIVTGGIRFRNLNPGFPFVEATANFDLLEPTAMQQVASIANRQFAAFAPKGLLVVGPPDVALRNGLERWTQSYRAHRRQPASRASIRLVVLLSCDDRFRRCVSCRLRRGQASTPHPASSCASSPGGQGGAAAAGLASFHDRSGGAAWSPPARRPFMERGPCKSSRYS